MEKMNEIGKIFTIFVTITVTILTSGTTIFNVSQAQELSPEQKQAMCDPSNPKLNFVNTTESHICGIPPTPVNQTNTTTFTSPPKSLTPSATIP
jgi:hypothetical protein